MIRFSFSIFAGVIQTFLLNGPTTNDKGCAIRWDSCWSWGLTSKRGLISFNLLSSAPSLPLPSFDSPFSLCPCNRPCRWLLSLALVLLSLSNGHTVQQYYALIFSIIFVLYIPILFLKEISPPSASTHASSQSIQSTVFSFNQIQQSSPSHTIKSFVQEIWNTMTGLTSTYLIVYVVGIVGFAQLSNNASVYLQVSEQDFVCIFSLKS